MIKNEQDGEAAKGVTFELRESQRELESRQSGVKPLD